MWDYAKVTWKKRCIKFHSVIKKTILFTYSCVNDKIMKKMDIKSLHIRIVVILSSWGKRVMKIKTVQKSFLDLPHWKQLSTPASGIQSVFLLLSHWCRHDQSLIVYVGYSFPMEALISTVAPMPLSVLYQYQCWPVVVFLKLSQLMKPFYFNSQFLHSTFAATFPSMVHFWPLVRFSVWNECIDFLCLVANSHSFKPLLPDKIYSNHPVNITTLYLLSVPLLPSLHLTFLLPSSPLCNC